MPVKLTHEAEKERLASKPIPKWGLLTTMSIVEALHFARDNGWFEKKVQVRMERTAIDEITYHVEPYEEGCGCSGILKYLDFFDPPEHS